MRLLLVVLVAIVASLTACKWGARLDADEDGYGIDEGDCDDRNASINPGADERCDGVDNDCDGRIDLRAVDALTVYTDADEDGFGDDRTAQQVCEAPEGTVPNGGDCEDGDARVYPGATEICNNQDDDCDGRINDEDVNLATWWLDHDQDGYGDASAAGEFCDGDHQGWVSNNEDCDDSDSRIHPRAQELCDDVDNDCDGDADHVFGDSVTGYADSDADGYGDPAVTSNACPLLDGFVANSDDCDDDDPGIHPGAPEVDCSDATDYNCDGSSGYTDDDQDGYAACEECDDADPLVHPDADETCDGRDNDCDGTIDNDDAIDVPTWYADADHDSFGAIDVSIQTCRGPAHFTLDGSDCDDAAPLTYPGALEYCDGIDTDCDGTLDNDGAVDALLWYADLDNDGFGDPSTSVRACAAPLGYVEDNRDCDGTNADVSPSEHELCDGLDNDCDGVTDEDDADDAPTWYGDFDSDGFGDAGNSVTSCQVPINFVADDTDCDDADARVAPNGVELCNGTDDDCNGVPDDDYALDASTWYADADADSFGDPGAPTPSCAQPAGFVADDTDCDDTEADTNPAGFDLLCDDVDADCNGADGDLNVDDDGATWSGAYTSIQDAIDAAGSGDLICVAPGDYHELLTIQQEIQLVALACEGGSTASDCRSETLLDGDAAGTVVTFDGQSSAITSASRFSGFTVTNGYADFGGGLALSDASPTLDQLRVVSNEATAEGGGLYLLGTTTTPQLMLWDATFDDNYAPYGGGGALDAAQIDAGNINFVDNVADVYGGGFYLHNAAQLSISATDASAPSRVSGDGTQQNAFMGGGVYLTTSVLVLSDTIIEDLVAEYGGGGVYATNTSSVTGTNVEFLGNTAGTPTTTNVAGGGLAILNGVLGFTDVTFEDNSVSGDERCYGGGLYAYESTTTLANMDFYANALECYRYGVGGGAFIGAALPGLVQTDCILTWNDGEVYGNSAVNVDTSANNYWASGGGVAVSNCGTASTPPELTNLQIGGLTDDGLGGYVESNWSSAGGGHLISGTYGATLNSITISGNVAAAGGGVYVRESGDLVVYDMNLVNNSATDIGGGLYAYATPTSQIHWVGGEVSGNTAVGNGGGLNVTDGALALTDVDFLSNAATGLNAMGGAVRSNAAAVVHNCDFVGNSSSSNGNGGGGGAWRQQIGAAEFYNVAFVSNDDLIAGGALTFANADGVLENTIFADNSANTYGGAMTLLGDVTIANASFVGNELTGTAGVGGTAIHVVASGDLTLTNVEFSDNLGSSGMNALNVASGAGLTASYCNLYNNLPGDTSGAGIFNLSNMLATNPQYVNTSGAAGTWDLQLQGTSPLLNAGDPSTAYNDADGTRADIGAYGGPGSASW